MVEFIVIAFQIIDVKEVYIIILSLSQTRKKKGSFINTNICISIGGYVIGLPSDLRIDWNSAKSGKTLKLYNTWSSGTKVKLMGILEFHFPS